MNTSAVLRPTTADSCGGIQSSELFHGVSTVQSSVADAHAGPQVYGISSPVILRADISIIDMVSREMLCELVRNAFQQSVEQQLRYEQLLRQDFGRHSKGEVSARV